MGKKPKKHISPNLLQPTQAIAHLNEKYCVVLEGGKVRVLTFSEQHGRQTVDYLTFADFSHLHMHRSVIVGTDADGKPILVPLGKYWLSHSERRQFAGVTFEPLKPSIVAGKLNLWRGWGVDPKAGDWSLMKKHILEVASSNSEHENYILNFAAWCVQHPDEPAEAALVFRGPEGTGRGIFARMLCRMFGQHSHQISSIKHITGNFNKHLRDCCLLFADEAFWPGYRDQEGNLRRLITEPTLFIEPKGMDAFEVKNMIHLVMVSNSRWVIPASLDARRFAMFDVAEHHKQDADWFKPLYRQMAEGGTAAMLHDLLERDLGEWHPRQIIKTAAMRDQQLLSLDSIDPLEGWWFTLISNGVLPEHFVCGFGGPLPDNNSNPRRAYSQDLFKHARECVPQLKFQSDHMLGKALRERGCAPFNNEGRGWEFPPLPEARARWTKKMPDYKWDDELTDWRPRPLHEEEKKAEEKPTPAPVKPGNGTRRSVRF
jgi:hypothetical protein